MSDCAAQYNQLSQNDAPLPAVHRYLVSHDCERWTAARYRDDGFKSKSLVSQAQDIWTEEEKEKVQEALKNYARNEEDIYQSDPYGYLSRQTLGNSKTPQQVEHFLKDTYKI